jgi:hypothetical protein
VDHVGGAVRSEVRLRLQNIYISGGARLTQTLRGRGYRHGTTGGAVINGILSGADLIYIAMGSRPMDFRLRRLR